MQLPQFGLFLSVYPYCMENAEGRKTGTCDYMCKAIKKGVEISLIQPHGNGTCNSRLYEDFFIIFLFIVEGVKKIIHTQYINIIFLLKSSTRVQKKSLSLSFAGLLLLPLLVVVFAKKYI